MTKSTTIKSNMTKPTPIKSTSNPFIKTDMNQLKDPTKMIADFKIPSVDMKALIDVQRKNIEAFTVVNQTAFEQLQSFASRQTELMRQGLEETARLMSAVMSSSSTQDKVMHQAEVSKSVVEKCMAHMRDATETLAKCNSHAMETVSNRMSDGLEELRGLIKADLAV
jgi:phasin family protein